MLSVLVSFSDFQTHPLYSLPDKVLMDVCSVLWEYHWLFLKPVQAGLITA